MSDDTFFLFDLRGMRRKKVMSALDGGLILLDGGPGPAARGERRLDLAWKLAGPIRLRR